MSAAMAGGERPLTIATRLAAAAGVPPGLLDELHRLHTRQWRLEDKTRLPGTSPEAIAAVKAEIDRSNARRHQLIDLIDAAVSPPEVVRPCRFYSETVGELCDRLLILDLKQRALASVEASEDVPGVERVCRHMSMVVTQLIGDLTAGRAVLPPRVGVKVYNGSPSPSDTGVDAGHDAGHTEHVRSVWTGGEVGQRANGG